MGCLSVCVCVRGWADCQGISTAPARPRHCRRTTGHQHCSDKPSHHITNGHVAHSARDTAVASHLHVIANHRDIYWERLRALLTQEQSCASRTTIPSRVKGIFSINDLKLQSTGCLDSLTITGWTNWKIISRFNCHILNSHLGNSIIFLLKKTANIVLI